MNEVKDPCRYCTDKPVCREQCVKASPYINRLRADMKQRMEEVKRRGKGD